MDLCGGCLKPVTKYHIAIECDECQTWWHLRKCAKNAISVDDYHKAVRIGSRVDFVCEKCETAAEVRVNLSVYIFTLIVFNARLQVDFYKI